MDLSVEGKTSVNDQIRDRFLLLLKEDIICKLDFLPGADADGGAYLHPAFVSNHGDPSWRVARFGLRSVATTPIPGRPQTAIGEDTIHQVETAVLENRHIPVCHLAQDVKISV